MGTSRGTSLTDRSGNIVDTHRKRQNAGVLNAVVRKNAGETSNGVHRRV